MAIKLNIIFLRDLSVKVIISKLITLNASAPVMMPCILFVKDEGG